MGPVLMWIALIVTLFIIIYLIVIGVRKFFRLLVSKFQPVKPVETIPNVPAPELVKVEPVIKENKSKVIAYLRQKQESNTAFDVALQVTGVEFSDEVNEGYIIDCAARAGYPALEVAKVMNKYNYSPSDIIEMLEDTYDLDTDKTARILLQVFTGKTIEEEMEFLLQQFDDADDLEDLIPFLLEFSSPVKVGSILYRKTEFRLATIIVKLGIRENTPVIAELAKEADVDLEDEDEYKSFRDDEEFSFGEMVKILAAAGKDAETILEVEHEYDSFDLSDESHGEAIFESLRACNFKDLEILEAIDKISESIGEILGVALENNVSLETLAAYIDPSWTHDLKALWENLIEAGVEESDAVEIMYAVIPPEKRRWHKQPTEESQAEKKEEVI